MLLLKLVLIFSILTTKTIESKEITVKIKKLKCEHDPSIFNGSYYCKVKPTRDGAGNTTVLYTFRKPCNDMNLQMKLFYKYGVIYRPFMVDVDVDICGYFKKPHVLGVFLENFRRVINEDFPNVLHACPYVGEEGYRNVDMDKFISRVIPQVVPKGYYKVIVRFYLKNNRTFFMPTLEVFVDAVDPLKSFEMGK